MWIVISIIVCFIFANVAYKSDQAKRKHSIEKQKDLGSFKCNCCNGEMIEKIGKYGKFYGCSNYPTCKNTMDYF